MSHPEPAGTDRGSDRPVDSTDSSRVWTTVRIADAADHWGLVMAYGVFTLVIGLVLALWPSETITVVAVLVAIQLVATGLLRIVLAAFTRSVDGAGRVLLVLAGSLALVVGLLCLRDPLQSVLVLGMVIGAWLVIAGVADLIGSMSSHRDHRGWDVAGGVISVLAGGFLLVNPDTSLRIFVIALCAWLLLTGGVAVVIAWALRSDSRSSTGVPRLSLQGGERGTIGCDILEFANFPEFAPAQLFKIRHYFGHAFGYAQDCQRPGFHLFLDAVRMQHRIAIEIFQRLDAPVDAHFRLRFRCIDAHGADRRRSAVLPRRIHLHRPNDE